MCTILFSTPETKQKKSDTSRQENKLHLQKILDGRTAASLGKGAIFPGLNFLSPRRPPTYIIYNKNFPFASLKRQFFIGHRRRPAGPSETRRRTIGRWAGPPLGIFLCQLLIAGAPATHGVGREKTAPMRIFPEAPEHLHRNYRIGRARSGD